MVHRAKLDSFGEVVRDEGRRSEVASRNELPDDASAYIATAGASIIPPAGWLAGRLAVRLLSDRDQPDSPGGGTESTPNGLAPIVQPQRQAFQRIAPHHAQRSPARGGRDRNTLHRGGGIKAGGRKDDRGCPRGGSRRPPLRESRCWFGRNAVRIVLEEARRIGMVRQCLRRDDQVLRLNSAPVPHVVERATASLKARGERICSGRNTRAQLEHLDSGGEARGQVGPVRFKRAIKSEACSAISPRRAAAAWRRMPKAGRHHLEPRNQCRLELGEGGDPWRASAQIEAPAGVAGGVFRRQVVGPARPIVIDDPAGDHAQPLAYVPLVEAGGGRDCLAGQREVARPSRRTTRFGERCWSAAPASLR